MIRGIELVSWIESPSGKSPVSDKNQVTSDKKPGIDLTSTEWPAFPTKTVKTVGVKQSVIGNLTPSASSPSPVSVPDYAEAGQKEGPRNTPAVGTSDAVVKDDVVANVEEKEPLDRQDAPKLELASSAAKPANGTVQDDGALRDDIKSDIEPGTPLTSKGKPGKVKRTVSTGQKGRDSPKKQVGTRIKVSGLTRSPDLLTILKQRFGDEYGRLVSQTCVSSIGVR